MLYKVFCDFKEGCVSLISCGKFEEAWENLNSVWGFFFVLFLFINFYII